MKLITAIVNKEDSKNVCNQLLKNKFYVTRLATTGGFLMAGNMTLLICTEDEKVDDCIGIISQCCKQRTLSTGISRRSAISSALGSWPYSCSSWLETFLTLLMVSTICTGMRMVRAWSAMARVMA